MKGLFASPLLSLALFALWLLLNDSVSVGHLLIAAVVALGAPWLSGSLRPQGGHVSKPLVLLRLTLVVGRDVVWSALNVARGVLVAWRRPPRGTFVRIPLELRDAQALTALAIITTVVPGTVWSELSPDRSTLLLHVWDLDDERGFIEHFKHAYERPLLEIFQ